MSATPPGQATRSLIDVEVRSSARLIALIRVLLLALAVGVFEVSGLLRRPIGLEMVSGSILWLLLAVMILAVALMAAVPWIMTRRQLLVHLVFDCLWCGGVIYLAGGVVGSGALLLFAVVLTGTLVLPGVQRVVLPFLAALILILVAGLYLIGKTPLPPDVLVANEHLVAPGSVLGNLLIQLIGIVILDYLGHLLARRQEEQHLLVGDLLDQLVDGVAAVDRHGRVLMINEAARRLVGQQASERLVPADLAHMARPGEQPLSVLAGVGDVVRTIHDRAGRYLRLRGSDLRGRRGRVIGRLLTITDETEIQRIEADARRVEHLAQMVEMAAGIAHEVRNPLASLRGCAQELDDILRELDQRDAASLARIIVGESDRLARVIEDFLGLARQPGPEPEPVDPLALVTAVVEQLRHERDLPCALHLTTQLPVASSGLELELDPDHLRQVLLNLIQNAIDAVRAQDLPRVTVRIDPPDPAISGTPTVWLRIIDNGPGIPEGQLDRIFTPFYSTKPRGTGLGLTLVQRLVRSNGGMVAITRGPDGAGTEVSIAFPARISSNRAVN